MHIAIIGAGRVGSSLGSRFAGAGHAVSYGVRNPADTKYRDLSMTGTIAEVCARAELILLCTPWAGAESALMAAGDLSGKVLVDTTNPIGPGLVLTHANSDSGAEQVARWAVGARVVKAFNTIGVEVMRDPRFGDRGSVLWLCGDDHSACASVEALAREIGFEPVRLGGLMRARFQEPAALVWISATAALGREFSWGLLRR